MRVQTDCSTTVEVNSLEEASRACKNRIKETNVGASQWLSGDPTGLSPHCGSGNVIDNDGNLIARICYNGRVCLL